MTFELGIKGLVVIVQEEKKPHYLLKESIPGIACNLVDVNHRDMLEGKPGKSPKRLGGSRVKDSVCPSKAFRSFRTI